MSTVRRGNSAEVFVARWLEERGWVVGSRRHIGGAADLLAVNPDGATWLVEVKARKNPYEGFRRADRLAMKQTPLPPGGERWLVNKRGQALEWIAEPDWP